MKRILILLSLALGTSTTHAWEPPAATPPREVTFPLDLAILDPDAKVKAHPYIVMFEGGVDDKGRNVRGPIGRLEALRGQSKLFPESNQNAGLPVVLRGLRFHRFPGPGGAGAHYQVELQGEFNMVRVPVSEGDMKKFLAGQRVTFLLASEKNYGVAAYNSSIKMEIQLVGDEMFIFDCTGDFTFREGLRRYTSKTKRLTPPSRREYLYRAERLQLPNLPSI